MSGFSKIIQRMYDWVLSWADHKWAVPILCLVSFTEASIFLVPPDVLIMALGASKPRKALWYALWTTVFSFLGALLGYWIGMTLWDSIQDYAYAYLFKPEHFELVKMQFAKNTFLAIVIGAFTPIPFKAFTILGGVFGAPLIPFMAGTIVGRSARYFMIGGLFFFFGQPIKTFIDKHFEKLTFAITGACLVLAAVYWYAKN